MTGTATISVEIELGWGFHDKADPSEVPELSEDGQKEREALDWFLSVCDEAGVPVTFDIVGHLLLESCDGNHEGPHPDGWFDRDPGTNAETDPLFYFPDVIEKIREADVDHEIATHTFSHVLCDEVDEDVIDWELGKTNYLLERPVSLVPPRHKKPPLDALKSHDINVLRVSVDEEPPSKAISKYFWTLTRNHPIKNVRERNGIVETYTSPLMTLTAPYLSRGISPSHIAYRIIPKILRQNLHEKFLLDGLEDAVQNDSSVHYWTHLYNLAKDSQRTPIEQMIKLMGQCRQCEAIKMEDMID